MTIRPYRSKYITGIVLKLSFETIICYGLKSVIIIKIIDFVRSIYTVTKCIIFYL